MDDEYIEEILIEITREFTKPQNFNRLIEEQVLANAIFYSFAVGALRNDDNDAETIRSLEYVIQWIEEKEHLLKGFKVKGDNDE